MPSPHDSKGYNPSDPPRDGVPGYSDEREKGYSESSSDYDARKSPPQYDSSPPLADPSASSMKASQETRDEPFKAPMDPGYMGYTPQPHYDSSDVERNMQKPYHPDGSSADMDDSARTPLVANTASGKSHGYYKMDYADPAGAKDTRGHLAKLLSKAQLPLEQRIENKKRGVGVQQRPFVVYILTAAMLGVFIYELVLNGKEQGSPISLKPFINPMLGPSSSALIYMGARFPPCMKMVTDVPPTMLLPCMDNTANPVSSACPVSELCSFGYDGSGDPNQWFRFITAIFLHAGIIHILLNMFAQWTLSAHIEKEMGSGGFLLTYFAAGIFGNVLGGNFALVGVPSVGASGAIFGTLAVTWVDLVAHWKYHFKPVRKLIFMTIELAIGIAIGFIPYVDNFAHLGGFLMGLFFGIIFYPVISETKRHRLIMWGFRLVAIPLAIVLFVVLSRNFYTSDPYAACAGCRYLSCIPMAANNYCKGTGLTMTNTST